MGTLILNHSASPHVHSEESNGTDRRINRISLPVEADDLNDEEDDIIRDIQGIILSKHQVRLYYESMAENLPSPVTREQLSMNNGTKNSTKGPRVL